MKNIVKTIIFAALVTGFFSCEDDNDPVVAANGFELRKDATVTPPTVLTDATATDVFGKFEWDKANNGPATVSTYTLQVFDHNDTSLSNPVEYTGDGLEVTTTSRKASLTVAEFNNLINSLPTYKCSEMDIDIRIKSTLGTNPNPFIQYSNPINVKVTGYSLKLPVIALVKDGNTPSTEPRIAASTPASNSDYEGYMYLEAGNYKFYQPDACQDFASALVYGGSAGTLDSSASAASIAVATAGHYLVKVNLATNTYTLSRFTTFGIFGRATRSGLGFDNQVPFDYDATTKIWSYELDLLKGKKFKFKSNLWTGTIVVPTLPNPPYAPGTATTSVSILGKTATPFTLQENNLAGSGEITVPGADDGTREKYRIELDVSNPRKYTYKMTKI
ncbi:SusE domain-containing protein [Flavobacterium phycosphaerae]|uniref:SusE domain-containing protein n=1 Tax=Flavobacterium phycosphaerae TaxID=2697515 RepID=UPI00138A2D8A|nr:SusE domain-containing protein [Flavobacterium phycosphaerae]